MSVALEAQCNGTTTGLASALVLLVLTVNACGIAWSGRSYYAVPRLLYTYVVEGIDNERFHSVFFRSAVLLRYTYAVQCRFHLLSKSGFTAGLILDTFIMTSHSHPTNERHGYAKCFRINVRPCIKFCSSTVTLESSSRERAKAALCHSSPAVLSLRPQAHLTLEPVFSDSSVHSRTFRLSHVPIHFATSPAPPVRANIFCLETST